MTEPRRRRFAVVGAGGVAGLATLKVVSQELQDQIKSGECEVVGFEQRKDLGGVWFSDPHPARSPQQEWPESAIYESLTTNIPHPLMFYPSYLASPSTPLFMSAQVVQDYMQDYASLFNLQQYIKFNLQVNAAVWDQSTKQWRVVCQGRGSNNNTEVSYFDHLFVANGHYRHPFVPNIAGFNDWARSSFRSHTHSVWYRNPEPYKDRNVLVIGGGRSGIDISDEVSTVAEKTVHSIRSREDVEFDHITQ